MSSVNQDIPLIDGAIKPGVKPIHIERVVARRRATDP